MTQSTELSFYQKLSKIQNELVAKKDKENKFGGFSYRTAEGILAAVKPHLAAHGLFLSIQDEIVFIGREGVHETSSQAAEHKVTTAREVGRYYLRSTVSVTDGEKTHSVSAMARESFSKKGMDDAQVTGACSSYARKYALNGFFGIDDSKQDPDANHGSDAMMAKVDEVLDACTTREEAIQKMQAIKKSPKCNKAVLKYATEKFNSKFSQ